MTRALILSNQDLEEIAEYHQDAIDGLNLLFETLEARNDTRYLGYTPEELVEQLDKHINETDLRSSLAVLSLLDATLCTDYENRCEKKMKDPLSRAFREHKKVLQKKRIKRVRLDDILQLWVIHHPELKDYLSEYRSALNLRHWLAHGRYWLPKLGRKFDYAGIEWLALQIFEIFPLAFV